MTGDRGREGKGGDVRGEDARRFGPGPLPELRGDRLLHDRRRAPLARVPLVPAPHRTRRRPRRQEVDRPPNPGPGRPRSASPALGGTSPPLPGRGTPGRRPASFPKAVRNGPSAAGEYPGPNLRRAYHHPSRRSSRNRKEFRIHLASSPGPCHTRAGCSFPRPGGNRDIPHKSFTMG
jgi:hypothetical protein